MCYVYNSILCSCGILNDMTDDERRNILQEALRVYRAEVQYAKEQYEHRVRDILRAIDEEKTKTLRQQLGM